MNTTTHTLRNAHLGNGAAIHATDKDGILCNRWGTVNGVWKSPRYTDADVTCKRCMKLAGKRDLRCDECGHLVSARESGETAGAWCPMKCGGALRVIR